MVLWYICSGLRSTASRSGQSSPSSQGIQAVVGLNVSSCSHALQQEDMLIRSHLLVVLAAHGHKADGICNTGLSSVPCITHPRSRQVTLQCRPKFSPSFFHHASLKACPKSRTWKSVDRRRVQAQGQIFVYTCVPPSTPAATPLPLAPTAKAFPPLGLPSYVAQKGPHSQCAVIPTIMLLIISSLLPRASLVALSKLPVIFCLTLQLLTLWGKD